MKAWFMEENIGKGRDSYQISYRGPLILLKMPPGGA